ncbi:ArsR/SmtB family transcription factor [Marinicrinis sediminis]|uniref:ArsR/SmtB family transcription factor n=1 Tax=Marinicrinis sediminis TaxID=1652465 RepID=A0ABW5R9G8_9BACL
MEKEIVQTELADLAELAQWADLFKLLGDRNRLTIVALLKEREMCVCELVEALQTSQPNISQHMRKLKDAGLVKEERKGQWIYYSLTDQPHLQDVLTHLPSQEEKMKQITPVNCC